MSRTETIVKGPIVEASENVAAKSAERAPEEGSFYNRVMAYHGAQEQLKGVLVEHLDRLEQLALVRALVELLEDPFANRQETVEEFLDFAEHGS